MEYTIDAKQIAIGRTATKAAMILMGKNLPGSKKNEVSDHKVTIINASLAKISPKKSRETKLERYTGYPSGLIQEDLETVIKKKGHAELFKLAVYGMLPGNKLRDRIMKNLIITE